MKADRNERRGVLVKCIRVFIWVLVPLLTAEIALRVYFGVKGKDINIFRPSFLGTTVNDRGLDRRRFISVPFLPYAPRPFDSRTLRIYRSETTQIVSYTYSNNSWGLRSPEISFNKPPHTKRIITLGGSTTWDGPTNDLTWPSLLQKKLQEHYQTTGETIEVINMAFDASNSPMSFAWLSFLGVEFSPDLVINYDGINDYLLLGHKGVTPDYRSTMSHFNDQTLWLQPRLPRWAFRSYLISVATHVIDYQMLGADAWSAVFKKSVRLPPSDDPVAGIEYFQRNLRLMRAVSKEYGAGLLAATVHWADPVPAQVLQNQRMRQFFQQSDMPYVDLDAMLPHNDWSIHVDIAHWTTKGLNLVADAFADRVIADNLLGLNGPRQGQPPMTQRHSTQAKPSVTSSR